MTPGNVTRVLLVLGGCVAAIGSSSSNSRRSQSTAPEYEYGQSSRHSQDGAPPPQDMDPARALGLWRSTFGAVKIEADASEGGLATGAVQGIWVYQRQGQEVIGYFAGHLRGNVLQFRWQEPNDPPLVGEGYLVFDPQGRQYSGRWWSDRRDRIGDWNGWRQGAQGGGQPGGPEARAPRAGVPRAAPPPRAPAPDPYEGVDDGAPNGMGPDAEPDDGNGGSDHRGEGYGPPPPPDLRPGARRQPAPQPPNTHGPQPQPTYY